MVKKQTIKMPLEYVEKTLAYLGLDPVGEELTSGNCTQLWLTKEGFSHVNINTFKTGSVVVQPHDDLVAHFVRNVLALRAARLRSKGKI